MTAGRWWGEGWWGHFSVRVAQSLLGRTDSVSLVDYPGYPDLAPYYMVFITNIKVLGIKQKVRKV